MYWVYVLEGQNSKTLYIGYTRDLEKRITEHNAGYGSQITSQKDEKWELIYCEGYRNKRDAVNREKFLKSGSGRKFLNKQLKHYFNE